MKLSLRNAGWRVRGKDIVHGASLDFAPGQLTAIIGPNGAGKSTLLRLVSGLLPATSGDVQLDDVPITTFSSARLAASRAMLMQDSPLRAQFTLRELVAMGGQISAPFMSAPVRFELAGKLLERVGLAAFAERDVMDLSGGERQRVHLARVLMQLEAAVHGTDCPPGFLLLDEPISAQDLSRQHLVLNLARAHATSGGGVVLVIHDLNWAAACADRIVVMHEGSIFAQGAPEQVLTNALASHVFGLEEGRVRMHVGSGKPYVLPHDMIYQ
ncbi:MULTISPECIES: ATP-binding cassette domain-containing protein [Acetobacter]|uniref:Hemin ABC transporter ATP-binding protein n=2 Tax=Acetobacter TaxID=434 RepID=A0AAN1U8Y8_9PROT|nr:MULTISPECIES: ATP-binding cassette domain-containing protein [Acetobacter]ASL40260.1 hemin ABC transporter ATP-binding protein [Acetobacter oryzifermentans]AXN00310.1 hemin ABC transporter ATP-binding protein [Acetobacter pomorum]KAA8394329.1 ATP-binding cassette domain-containing protein [Acetobacter sp. DmW_125127]KAA8395237.1 ATP-binding cassette domain-containing protein [Acetobacter sp. DmW_125128]KAA8395280.1 ATP-binding cassette domain-containing protein [Acetobacter sp. DmW_125124]